MQEQSDPMSLFAVAKQDREQHDLVLVNLVHRLHVLNDRSATDDRNVASASLLEGWTAGGSSDFRPHVGFSPESTRIGYDDTSTEAIV
jgi:hypothetical protein